MTSAEEKIKPTAKLETIQLLRAIAVMAVLISHVANELKNMLGDRMISFDLWLFPGNFGVDLFFVISGFIMVYTAQNHFGKPGAAINFLRRRIIRIVPLYWIMTSVMILIVILLPQNVRTATSDWGQWLSSYFFIPYARSGDGMIRPVLGLGWTLQYEMYFYVIFALGLLLPRRMTLLFIIGAMVGLLVASHLFILPGAIGSFLRDPMALEFAMGMFLGWVYVKGWRINRATGIAAVLLGGLILIIVPIFADNEFLWRYVYYGIPGLLMVATAVLTAGDDMQSLPIWIVGLGDISYATYLVHPFVIGAVSLFMHKAGIAVTLTPLHLIFSFSLVVILAILATGYLTHHYLDLPLTNWIKQHWPAQ